MREECCDPIDTVLEQPSDIEIGTLFIMASAKEDSPTVSYLCCYPWIYSLQASSSSYAVAVTPVSSLPAQKWGHNAGGLSVRIKPRILPQSLVIYEQDNVHNIAKPLLSRQSLALSQCLLCKAKGSETEANVLIILTYVRNKAWLHFLFTDFIPVHIG